MKAQKHVWRRKMALLWNKKDAGKNTCLVVCMLNIYLNFLFQVSKHFITKQTRDSNLKK